MNLLNIKNLTAEIARLNPLQGSFINNSVSALSIDEESLFQAYLNYCESMSLTAGFLAEAYNLIVNDTFREQVYFKRHGRYRYSNYEDVAASVYHSPEYMKKYMQGLALSTFLWPNHLAMYRFFIETLPKKKDGNYLEIGPGHGFHFMEAMKHTQYSFFQGVDISATSVEMTKSILSSGAFSSFTDYAITKADFFEWQTSEKFDCLVMAEVLEHVEQPGDFLRQLYRLANDDAHVFITTCINAPAIDHIYLYPDMDSLRQQVNDSGFCIAKELVVPYTGQTLEQTVAEKLPINTAMVLHKQC